MNIIELSLLISLINLDNQNILSLGISRPMITGAIIGFFINNLYFGILTGCIIELILINLMPVGAFVPPNGTLATGVTLVLCYHFHVYKTGLLLPFILIYGIFWGHIVKRFTKLLWKKNTVLVEIFIKEVQKDRIHFAPYNISALLIDFILYAVLAYTGCYLGNFLFNYIIYKLLSSIFIIYIFNNVLLYLPLFSLIYLLSSFDILKKGFLVLTGMVVTVIMSIFINSPVIIFLLIGFFSFVIYYIFNLYKEYYYEL